MKIRFNDQNNILFKTTISIVVLLGLVDAILFSLNAIFSSQKQYLIAADCLIAAFVLLLFLASIIFGGLFTFTERKEPITEAQEQKSRVRMAIKWVALVIAIILMAFAQAILSYVGQVGMAPIDSFTTAFSYMVSGSYSTWNYVVVGTLVISAVLIAKPENKLLMATSFITGFILAFIVRFLITNVIQYLPGLSLDDDGNGHFDNIGAGIGYFFLGYFLLINSIAIWINVGFGLRPYEALLVSLIDRNFKGKQFVFWRNTFDLSFMSLALIFSLASLGTNPLSGGDTWIGSRNVVGPGTVMFVVVTGFITNYIKIAYSKIIK